MLIDIPGLQPLKQAPTKKIKLINNNYNLQVGQLIKVFVVSKINNSQLMLNLDGANINARTSQQFFPGEELLVKVENSAGETLFQIKNRTLSQEVLNQALRHILPQHGSASELIHNIKQLNQLPKAIKQALPPSIKQLIGQINTTLANKSQLMSPLGLKQAIFNGGTFLESKLANNAPTHHLQQDFKGQLLQLLGSLNKVNTGTLNSHISQANEAKEIAALLGKDPGLTNNLSKDDTSKLEHAARLKRAANLIRSTNFSRPLLQPQTKPGQASPVNSYNHLTFNTTTMKSTLAHAGSYASQALQQQLNKASQQKLKHASLPIKGAFPQTLQSTQGQNSAMSLFSGNGFTQNLKEEVSQYIARIQANQLSSIPREGAIQPNFLLDVPINIQGVKSDLMQLMVQEEEPEDSQATDKKNWSITLALDIENIGPIQLKVSLLSEKIYANIWAELESTQALFMQRDYQLKQALKEEHLEIKSLSYHHGLKENDIDAQTLNVLDTKA